jgi:oxygen-dependent protoporphyrinogen oxidase
VSSVLTQKNSIAVLGGGITGLAAAHRLATLGYRVRLFEQSSRLGGVVQTEAKDGWLSESGPNSFQESSPEIGALLAEVGLQPEILEASPAAKNRYLVRDGGLVPLPMSPGAFLRSPLFSLGAKLRALQEIFSARRNRIGDVALAPFIRAHFGQEMVDYAVQPFVSGIYAGDPEKLSTRHAFPRLWQFEKEHGSLLRGQIAAARQRRAQGLSRLPRLLSFRRGLQALPDALAARLPSGTALLKVRVDGIVPTGPRWTVHWHDGWRTHTEGFDGVVAALPAPALARLAIGAFGEESLAGLAAVESAPVASLFLGFRRDQVTHPLDGFGALAPAVEKRALLGVIFSSTLFPGRAPAGHVALTVMIGGALQPELAALPPDQLWATVRRDLRDLLGVTGEPVVRRHAFWPQSIPQYQLGHERHLVAMDACERVHPGLFIGGNVRDGIALPNCLLAGRRLADRAAAFLGKSQQAT